MRQWRFKSIADDDKCLHSAVKSSQPNSGSSWRMCPLLTNPKQKTCRNSSWKNEKSESMPPPSSIYQWEEGAIFFKELLDIMGQLSYNFAWHNDIGMGRVRKCSKSWVIWAFYYRQVVGTSRVISDEFLPYAALIAQESLDEADKFMGVSTKYSVPQCTLKTEK